MRGPDDEVVLDEAHRQLLRTGQQHRRLAISNAQRRQREAVAGLGTYWWARLFNCRQFLAEPILLVTEVVAGGVPAPGSTGLGLEACCGDVVVAERVGDHGGGHLQHLLADRRGPAGGRRDTEVVDQLGERRPGAETSIRTESPPSVTRIGCEKTASDASR
jgi:hypothetical protein